MQRVRERERKGRKREREGESRKGEIRERSDICQRKIERGQRGRE